MSGVRLEVDGAVATIVLDRPPVDALSRAAIEALITALRTIDATEAIRVAVVTGAGRCFSAGVDLKERLASLEHGTPGPMDLGPAMYSTCSRAGARRNWPRSRTRSR